MAVIRLCLGQYGILVIEQSSETGRYHAVSECTTGLSTRPPLSSLFHFHLSSESSSLVCAVHGVTNVPSADGEEEEERLEEESNPATLGLTTSSTTSRCTGSSSLAAGRKVEVAGINRDDVKIIGELPRVGSEADVGHG